MAKDGELKRLKETRKEKRGKEIGINVDAGLALATDVSGSKAKRKNKMEVAPKKKKRKGEAVVEAVDEELQGHDQFEHQENVENDIEQKEADPVSDFATDATTKVRKNKKRNKKKRENQTSANEGQNLVQESGEALEDDVYYMSSGDEDCTTGMKKWLTDYHQQRPGSDILQQRIDDFIVAHEEKLEQERKEREARMAEDGWTVVGHHKGRKKTTDADSGIAVGSVAQAAVEDKLSKKKKKVGVDSDFYRFQKREAQRNEVMMLQSKFEEDKKRIQQLRAARKFRPY